MAAPTSRRAALTRGFGQSIAGETLALLHAEAGLMLARRILIVDRVLRQDWEAALALLDTVLEQKPDERQLYGLRLLGTAQQRLID